MNYLDTSVLTAYYSHEARSKDVQRLLSRIKAPTISPLVEVEFYSAISRKVRTGDLDASAARGMFSQFQLHLSEPRFHIVPIQACEYGLAKQWIEDLSSPLRALDALHLAAAFANKLVLVTADKALANSAKHFGMKHKLIS